MHNLKKQPKDFDLQKGSDFKRAETKLREKPAAEPGWKQDVSNPPLGTSAKAVLSRSDLADETRARVSPKPPRHREQLGGAGHLSERRALSVSFVRAAYGATAVKQNPGESAFV
ncbi:hypothetical protein [Desulfitobacterium hafniense]|nr:hypothetical protein [Desulfitobacterium hafniense]